MKNKNKQEKREMFDQNKNKKHIPVLQNQVLQYLLPKEGETYLDLTAGYGGHAEAILERTLQPNRATLVDRDRDAVEHLLKRFGKKSGPRIIQKDYLTASRELNAESAQFDIILADIGVSSPHLNSKVRGFSFSSEAPLDMRMDQSQELTAGTIVNSYSQAELENLLRIYGEEPSARKIAELICKSRPISTTTELAIVTSQAVRKRYKGRSKVHPATKTFQALRIAVNDELAQLEQSLPVWLDLLAPCGRLAVISFHSLEDRIVKHFFKEHSTGLDSPLSLLTKKPVMAEQSEIDFNPRARSAKLRAVAKK